MGNILTNISLFASEPLCFANAKNTSFATEPIVVYDGNAAEFFQHDHTPIKFKNGKRHGDNFEYATAIVADIDNTHSETMNDWSTIDDISAKLKEFGIKHLIVTSRNHFRSKNGAVARPKFHVYFPLSTNLYDKGKYTTFCKWCIKTLKSDPQVKSHAQFVFGFGDHTAPSIVGVNEGRCIDEVLTDDDLSFTESSPTSPCNPKMQQSHHNRFFEQFAESEWRNHLNDLEALGWEFFEKDNTTYVQTPEGSHSPGDHDGNIKDGVVYFFSKAPNPFIERKGYPITQFFAGAMFGNISRKGLAALAKQYGQSHLGRQTNQLPEPNIQEPYLKMLLEKMTSANFGSASQHKISSREYHVLTISTIIKVASKNESGLTAKNDFVYVYNGNFWKTLDKDEFKAFLAAAAIRLGVPASDALHYTFKDELYKQFVSDGHLPPPQDSETTLINLKNGTYEINEKKRMLRKPNPTDFLKYQLSFEHNETATAPKFNAFLNQVLPQEELQKILAEYIGYIFIFSLKLEKILILYGSGANGKSVFYDIIIALLGRDNVTSYKLSSLTAQNSYQRSELQNKLLNYASELNGKLETDTFKQLASGEPIEARQIYGKPYMMYRYARLMFNCNELPRDVENTNAFFRRFIIIPFEQTIPENKQDPELAQKIIDSELPGVFNWVLEGLQRLLNNRKFTESDIVRRQVEEYKCESDSVALFLEEKEYQPSMTARITVTIFFDEYKSFCLDDGYRPVSKKNFTKRCRKAGYTIDKKRGYGIYAEKKHLVSGVDCVACVDL